MNTTNEATPTVTPVEPNVAPKPASPAKAPRRRTAPPQARTQAKGAKAKAAAPRKATPIKKVVAKAPEGAGPRAGTKGATVLQMLRAKNGASRDALQKATGWQAHTVRGFLSIASRKCGIAIMSVRRQDGQRVYSIE